MKPNHRSRLYLLPLAVSLLTISLPAASARTSTRGSIFYNRKPGPPVSLTRAPYLQSLTPISVYIVWNTAKPASSLLKYRGPAGQVKSLAYSKKVGRHTVRLTGLSPGTTYRYTVGSNGRPLYTSSFRTPAVGQQAFSFAVWGDSGGGSTAQKQLAWQIDRQRPDFLVHTGDLIYDRGEQHNYNPFFFNVYRPTLSRAPFYGSLGNHDVLTARGQPFLDNFILPHNGPAGITPERNYSFDYGIAHFVVIDSNQSEATLRRTIAPWIERDIRASRALWKFAMFHHPPYSSGDHGDEIRTQRALAPVFSRLRFDAVFNGHDHHYERFKKIGGVVYIVTGAGGAGRYGRREYRSTTASFYNADWSFTQIFINGRTLRGRQITRGGKVVDDWVLQK